MLLLLVEAHTVQNKDEMEGLMTAWAVWGGPAGISNNILAALDHCAGAGRKQNQGLNCSGGLDPLTLPHINPEPTL